MPIKPNLDFTTHVDTGYRLIPARKLPPRPEGQTVLEQLLSLSPNDMPEARIVGMGGKVRSVPLKQYPTAFKDFAAVKTADDLVKFIAKYGPLTKAKRQEVLPLLDDARQMRECWKARGRESYLRNLDLKAHLWKDRKTGALAVHVTPSTLLDALWLQFSDSLSSGAVMRDCRLCANPFPAGGNSDRRLDAEFCSKEHQQRFNSLKRSNPALEEKRK